MTATMPTGLTLVRLTRRGAWLCLADSLVERARLDMDSGRIELALQRLALAQFCRNAAGRMQK